MPKRMKMERSGARKRAAAPLKNNPFDAASDSSSIEHTDVPTLDIPGSQDVIASTKPAPRPKEPMDGEAAKVQIGKYIKSFDFGRARHIAQAAKNAGHLTDEDIQSTVHEHLPSPEESNSLPSHHLLAVYAAAGHRRHQYTPTVEVRFSDEAMAHLKPEERRALMAHIKQIGGGKQ